MAHNTASTVDTSTNNVPRIYVASTLATISTLPRPAYYKYPPPPAQTATFAPGSLVKKGSTAITAFVRGRRLVVGNVGDSRAVLCSEGRALPMSSDHKPNKPEERRRIQALGGRVVYSFGIPRGKPNDDGGAVVCCWMGPTSLVYKRSLRSTFDREFQRPYKKGAQH